MNKKILFFVQSVVALCCVNMYAINNQETFLQANQLYTKGEYAHALVKYKAISKKGPAVWYNMGNCHYQEGNKADALVCWRRAQKNGQYATCVDSDHNIQQLLRERGQLSDSGVWGRSIRWLQHRGACMPLLLFQMLFLVSWYLVWLCWRWRKRYAVLVCLIGFSLLVSMSMVALAVKYTAHKDCCAVVRVDGTPFLSGPDRQYHAHDTLAQADLVVVHEARQDWYKVAHNGTVGWVTADAIIKV